MKALKIIIKVLLTILIMLGLFLGSFCLLFGQLEFGLFTYSVTLILYLIR